MITLKFPTLEFIKSHPRHLANGEYEQYEWSIFNMTNGPIYCRITYNEDDNNKIYLDMMVTGYCDRWCPKGFNKAYPVTKEGYEELKSNADQFINHLFDNILKTNQIYSKEWLLDKTN